MDNVLLVLLALVLVVLNGFYVAAEFGIVTLPASLASPLRRSAWAGLASPRSRA